jgi:hypothetical protein
MLPNIRAYEKCQEYVFKIIINDISNIYDYFIPGRFNLKEVSYDCKWNIIRKIGHMQMWRVFRKATRVKIELVNIKGVHMA